MAGNPAGDAGGKIKELTSSTDAALKALGDQNTAAIDLIGGVAGLIVAAAATGPVGVAALGIGAAVVGIIANLINLLDPTGQGQASLGQVSQQLHSLVQAEADTADEQRRDFIGTGIGGAGSEAKLLQFLKNHLHDSPPPGVQSNTQPILDSMTQLAPPDISKRGCPNPVPSGLWSVPLNYMTKWTDNDSADVKVGSIQHGYGEQDPPPLPIQPSGQVFNYTYVLPAYLYAVSTLVSIGGLIDPTFQQDFSDDIKNAVCLLQSVHDYIHDQGIRELAPGNLTLQNLAVWSSEAQSQFGIGVLGLPFGVIPDQSSPGSIGIEYGAVELFSGYSSMGIYVLQPPFDQNTNYDAAFQIRLLRRHKDVYRGAGLKKLQNTINNLSELIGQPSPGAGRSLGDWSIRFDIANIARSANLIRSDGTLHLSDVQTYLNNTPVKPTPQLVQTFNSLLSL
jgi:hypothetical protein